MRCPFCGASDTTVADTRINEDGDIVRRRRRCLSCDKRFSTYERAEIRLPQVVKKIDKVAYVRFASVYRSFEDVDEFSDLVKEVSRPGQRRG